MKNMYDGCGDTDWDALSKLKRDSRICADENGIKLTSELSGAERVLPKRSQSILVYMARIFKLGL